MATRPSFVVLMLLALSVAVGCTRTESRFIGIEMTVIPKGMVALYHIDPRVGVKVADVRDGTPAAAAGLACGDIIVRIDDTAIRSMEQFHRTIQHPGDLQLYVLSHGELRVIPCAAGVLSTQAVGYDETREAAFRTNAYATYPQKDLLQDWSQTEHVTASAGPLALTPAP